MAKITSYTKHPQSIVGPDGSHPNWLVNTVYDNVEWATGIVNDYDVSANQSSAFNTVTIARFVSIRTDASISVKFNSTSNDAVTVDANTTFNIDTLEVTNIFVTAAASANVKIFLT